jgi:hypothetical protein
VVRGRNIWVKAAVFLPLALVGLHLAAPASAEDGDTFPPGTGAELRSDAPTDAQGRYTGPVTVVLHAVDGSTGSGLAATEYRIDGGDWQPYEAPARTLLDGTAESLAQWRQAGPGAFTPQENGSVQTSGGLGMLWYPEQFRNVAITLQWRDARTDACCSNGGVFVRSPEPTTALDRGAVPQRCEMHPLALGLGEWVPVTCGHEIQINDGATDPQQTGSVYNFQSLNAEQARPLPQGQWNDYEIRTEGGGSYTVTVVRNGTVINRFANTPGKEATRFGDPPTDARQFAQGYIGLQNHGDGDAVQYRNVHVRDLDPVAAAFTVADPGTHVVEYRSTDFAGNTERIRSVAFTIT